MCAVYAFMRRADDISDDESMPIAERREVMSRVAGGVACKRGGVASPMILFFLR